MPKEAGAITAINESTAEAFGLPIRVGSGFFL